MKYEEKQIEEIAKYQRITNNNRDEYNPEYDFCVGCKYFGEPNGCNRLDGTCSNYERFIETYSQLEELEDKIENGTLKFVNKDSVMLSREEYEKLKSLYDTQKGAIMTSSIGDLPLTVEGLRKAVDEITRLNRVQDELQELNAKYYNEAKNLRRENKEMAVSNREYENLFVKEVKEKCITDPLDILNWYRNLYHTEDNHLEHGIVAYAINDLMVKYYNTVKETAEKILKRAKEFDKDFEKTGLYEYIMANFLSQNNSELK